MTTPAAGLAAASPNFAFLSHYNRRLVEAEVVKGIVALKAELKSEVMCVVFRDASFKDDVLKTNKVILITLCRFMLQRLNIWSDLAVL